MATEYHPLPRHRKQKWLLTNGQIAEEPDLEESESGRRVRVMGQSKSVYAKDIDDLIYRSVQNAAHRMGEDVWMRCDDTDPVTRLNNEIGSTPPDITAPHWVRPGSQSRFETSKVTWTFRHESLPVAARITVEMVTRRPHFRSDELQRQSSTYIQWLSTNRHDNYEPVVLRAGDPRDIPFSEHTDGSHHYEANRQLFADFMRDEAPNWMSLLGVTEYANEREAAAAVARLCKELDSLDQIEIPDLRNPAEPQFLTLGIYDTTYTREFGESIVDYLNGQPIVQQMMEHWKAMVDLFRRTGIVVDALEDSDFHAAINGDTDRLNVDLKPDAVSTPEGELPDTNHIVGFNLLTGTVTVSCSVRDMRDEDVATEYEIARIKAEAQGELDAFVGFHAGFLDRRHHDRHKRTVDERTVDADEVAETLGLSN